MCDKGNHQGFIADTSVTRRTLMLGMAAAGTLATVPACAEDPDAAKVTATDVTIATADGSADAALFVPAGKGKWPAVLMWPDIVGLRPVFREMGQRLAAQGYVVLVPNPYYRAQKAPVVQGSFDFGNKADRDRIMNFRNGLSDEMVDRDSRDYLAFLDAQPQTDKSRRAGVQGYCMSGPLSFRTAAVGADRIGAVATFHPSPLVTDEPSSPHLLIPKANASYLVLIAKNDAEEMPREKPQLDAAFAAARRPARVEVYPANHGWCVAGGQSYDEEQAERAWAELLAFYRVNLG